MRTNRELPGPLRVVEASVVRALVDLGTCTINRLSDLTVVDRTTLSRTLDRMEKHRGHLYNWYDTSDGRPLALPPDRQTTRRAALYPTRTGFAFQLSSAYSAIVRSELNLPVRATFRMAIRVQRSGSR